VKLIDLKRAVDALLETHPADIEVQAWLESGHGLTFQVDDNILSLMTEWQELPASEKDPEWEKLCKRVTEHRRWTSFGDGLEDDYASYGSVRIGPPVDYMTKEALRAELLFDDDDFGDEET
jgi:hypothetical protein